MGQRGEITVFLSLVLVCILSLLLGLLESARTAGARLYLRMAADSAISSVMSQYNRNLWDMYHLLFLEFASERAIEDSFAGYFEFYTDQENLYPMKRGDVKVTELTLMQDEEAAALEEEILAYMKYRLPKAAGNLAGLAGQAADASKAGDFRKLLEVCRDTGRKTRKLEKRRLAIEKSLKQMEEFRKKALEAAGEESGGRFDRAAGKLEKEMESFSGKVDAYETELNKISEHRKQLIKPGEEMDAQASAEIHQELMAYENVEQAAARTLQEYRRMEQELSSSLDSIRYARSLLGQEEEGETDWGRVESAVEGIELPKAQGQAEIDQEKSNALDRLEELLDKDLLTLVLPEGAQVSSKKASARGIPSENQKADGTKKGGSLEQILINEYVQMYFDSFLIKSEEGGAGEELKKGKTLDYEQEYLLCGEEADRKNLKGTAERLLAVRGGLNLLYLLNSPEKRAQADGLAAAVSAGNVPVQFIVSFFILTLWAFGEAVADVRALFSGGAVPLWKSESTWKTGLEGLLSLEFLNMAAGRGEEGMEYQDYLRILAFLQNRAERNYRMMDLIQWNVRRKQADFSVEACAYEVEITAEIAQRHIFLTKEEYRGTIAAAGSY